jgi:hypothetical protein
MAKVGQFSYENGVLSGPEAYMTERWEMLKAKIFDGKSALFEQAVERSPNIETALLVTVQTDYAGWLGTRELLRRTKC